MLEAENLGKMYGNRLLFKGVSFTLLSGSLHILQGANGTGKSTLIKIIAGLISKDAGNIHTDLKTEEIGYVGHGTFLYPQLTAVENLKFWHQAHTGKKIEEKEILAILEQVDLASFAYEKTGIFSRGMAQRVNLARVLLQKPKLFLLDEPTTGLDAFSRNILAEEMKKAKAMGSAIFWISHDGEKDKEIADYIHIIENKQLTTKAGSND